MKTHHQKKMLVAIDGSEHSEAIIKYICFFKAFCEWDVVLFHVFMDIPEFLLDMGLRYDFEKAARENKMWIEQQYDVIETFMKNSKAQLLDAGFRPDGITVRIDTKKKGVARDIIGEANRGYDAIVIGRKGKSFFEELIIGSVAKKIIDNLSSIPILLVGTLPPNNKMLIAFDGSDNAFRAVDFVAAVGPGIDLEIHLVNIIRGNVEVQFAVPMLFLPKINYEQFTQKIESEFDEAKKRLVKSGFKENQIITFIAMPTSSRAAAIINEARKGDYSSIVMGRRGLSRVEQFLMGRVTSKVLSTIRSRSVWIIT